MLSLRSFRVLAFKCCDVFAYSDELRYLEIERVCQPLNKSSAKAGLLVYCNNSIMSNAKLASQPLVTLTKIYEACVNALVNIHWATCE